VLKDLRPVHCKLAVNLDTDIPYWVEVSSFLNIFDQSDFKSRNVQNVTDAYLKDWFYDDSNGDCCFLIPPVSVHGGVTQFISGRHRTAVLMRHMNRLPLSFDSRDLSEADETWIESVASKLINLEVEEIELPDFPIMEALP